MGSGITCLCNWIFAMNVATMHGLADAPVITEDEAALYDRQIRLWGLDAQRRLRGAQVLLVGLGGLGAEVAKNIILSGVKSITFLDDTLVTKDDFFYQFLIKRADLGKHRAACSQARAQALNPMVEVKVDTDSIATKDEEYLKQFDIVCATCCTKSQLLRLDQTCHRNDINFYAGDIFGYYGYMFADLNEHEYAEEVTKDVPVKEQGGGEPSSKKAKMTKETVTKKKSMQYKTLQETLSVDWSEEAKAKSIKRMPQTYFIMQVLHAFREKHGRNPERETSDEDKKELMNIRDSVCAEIKVNPTVIPDDFDRYCYSQLSPVCAVVGGVLGQEIIKAVSQKDKPHNNFFFYNGVDGSGMVDCIST